MCDEPVLPDLIETNGEWPDVCARLYARFCEIFKCVPRKTVIGKPLVFDERRLDSDKEEGFWHVVTKGKGENRLFDSRRARRIGWLEMILDGTAPGVSRFSYLEGDGTKKLYFWIEEEDYVLILAERDSVVVLVTAYYVEHEWTRKDFRKKRAKGQSF